MSFQYYTLPQNTSGAAIIPISNMPVPLAFLTAVPDTDSTLVALRANIGWRGLSQPTRVLFKIWRGAPQTGNLICSVQDSAEGALDSYAVTEFSQIVSGLTANQQLTAVLTAETVDAGTQAQVIGPLTFTAFGSNTSSLSYFEFINNTFGSANIPVGQFPVPVAFVTIDVAPGETVTLRSSVGWIATGSSLPRIDVLFKLWRGAPNTGVLVASCDDSADVERSAVTTFSHTESGFTAAQTVTYVLTAEATNPGYPVSIAGAVSLTALTQDTLFYTLPNNTSGGANIPITPGGTPLATITLPAGSGSLISLRAAIGWAVASSASGNKVTPVLFKIWRGAPLTGVLVYSAQDSGESSYDFRKVTALAHVDSGVSTAQPVTYSLTAELMNAASGAAVIGPLTFTVAPQA